MIDTDSQVPDWITDPGAPDDLYEVDYRDHPDRDTYLSGVRQSWETELAAWQEVIPENVAVAKEHLRSLSEHRDCAAEHDALPPDIAGRVDDILKNGLQNWLVPRDNPLRLSLEAVANGRRPSEGSRTYTVEEWGRFDRGEKAQMRRDARRLLRLGDQIAAKHPELVAKQKAAYEAEAAGLFDDDDDVTPETLATEPRVSKAKAVGGRVLRAASAAARATGVSVTALGQAHNPTAPVTAEQPELVDRTSGPSPRDRLRDDWEWLRTTAAGAVVDAIASRLHARTRELQYRWQDRVQSGEITDRQDRLDAVARRLGFVVRDLVDRIETFSQDAAARVDQGRDLWRELSQADRSQRAAHPIGRVMNVIEAASERAGGLIDRYRDSQWLTEVPPRNRAHHPVGRAMNFIEDRSERAGYWVDRRLGELGRIRRAGRGQRVRTAHRITSGHMETARQKLRPYVFATPDQRRVAIDPTYRPRRSAGR